MTTPPTAEYAEYRRGRLCPFCGAGAHQISWSSPAIRPTRLDNMLCEACGEQWNIDWVDHTETEANRF